MLGQDMAQVLLQVRGLRHDAQHEELQGIQQTPILQRTLPQEHTHCSGRHTRVQEDRREHQDTESDPVSC